MPSQVEQKTEEDQASTMTTAQDHVSTLKQEIGDELGDIEALLSKALLGFQRLNNIVKFYEHELKSRKLPSETTVLELMQNRLDTHLELQNNEASRAKFLEQRMHAKQTKQPNAEHKTSQTTEATEGIVISEEEKEKFLTSVKEIVALCQEEVARLKKEAQQQQTPTQNRVTVQAKATSMELAMINAKGYNQKLLQETEATINKLKDSYNLYAYQLDQIKRHPPSKKIDLVALLKDTLATNQGLLINDKKQQDFLRKRIKERHTWNHEEKGEFSKSVQKIVELCQEEIERLEYQSEQDQETTASLDEEIYRAKHAAKKELSKIKDSKPVKTTRAARKQNARVTELKERIAYYQSELVELTGQPPLEITFKELIDSRLRELKKIEADLIKGKGSKKTNKEKEAHQKSILRMTRFYEKIIARLEDARSKPEQLTTPKELKGLEDFLEVRQEEREANKTADFNNQWNAVDRALTRNNELAEQEQKETSRASRPSKQEGRPKLTLSEALNGGRPAKSRSWTPRSTPGAGTPRGSKVGPKLKQPATANGQSDSSRRRSQQAAGASANGHSVQALGRPGAAGVAPLKPKPGGVGRPPTPKPSTRTRTIWSVGGKKI